MHKAKHSRHLILAIFISIGLIFVITTTVSAQTTTRAAQDIPAHASVLRAIPAIGSTITQAPTSVTVFTAENINPDPKVSNLFVYGPAGEATDVLISQGNAQVSLTNPEEMSVNIKPTPQHLNGVYVVHWITKSALDGDPDEGAFTFTVNTAATATATPAATATSSTGQVTPPTTTNTSGGTPIWLVAVIALVGLVIGLGAGLGLGRRRSVRPSAVSGSSLSAMRQSIKQEQKE
jgi:methionine-rich copper-binding protein CopC